MKYLVLLAAVLGFAFPSTAAGLPEKLRVLSVDLQDARVEMPGAPGSDLSQELRRLLETADPDVVCVQGAIDWENCERIAQLKPGLQVLTCSAFERSPQSALLARAGAVLSWVEEAETGGGFALAILQAGSQKLAVFSVQSAKPASTVPSVTDRVTAEVRKLQKFPQNRPEAFLIAGAGMVRTTVLTDSAFQTVSPEPRIENGGEFWASNAGFITRPRSVPLPGLRSPASVCDFDTSSSFSSKFAYQTPLLFPGETLASLQAAARPAPVAKTAGPLAWAAAIAAFLLFLAFLLFRQRPPSSALQVLPAGGADGLAPVHDPVRTNLLAWIKGAFLQRLISQRQQLLNNEAEATRRTMVIEEKLSNLQIALQARISAYEARIERLEQELTAATFDNRELIRAQIELLKEKVAKAKEEHALGRN